MPHPMTFVRLCVSLFVLGAMIPQSVAAEDTSDESLKEKAAYLEPLIAAVSDKGQFADLLDSMGDREAVRLEELNETPRLRETTAEEKAAIQKEMWDSLRKLTWLCDTGLKHFAESARVRNFRGNMFCDYLGRENDGVKEWHTAIMLDSNFGEPYNNLGMFFFHGGDYTLGFKNMDRALELEPNNPDFCFNMVQNYLIFGPQAQKKRGWSPKRVYKEAMKLSKRAVKNAPDDYQLLEDYAVNFLAAERFGVKANWKAAAKAWQAAREYASTKEKLFYTWLNEGRSWKSLERTQEARNCFEKALEIKPNSDVAKRLLDGLDDAA